MDDNTKPPALSEVEQALRQAEVRTLVRMMDDRDGVFARIAEVGLSATDFVGEIPQNLFARLLALGPGDDARIAEQRQKVQSELFEWYRDTVKDGTAAVRLFDNPQNGTISDIVLLRRRGLVSQCARELKAALYNPSLLMEAKEEAMRQAVDAFGLAHRRLDALVDRALGLAEDTPANVRESTPEELTHVPGLLDEIVAHSLRTAHRPNRILAFAGALAMLAHLMGRRFTDSHHTHPNLYVIALAPSGSGKQHPQEVNADIACLAEVATTLYGDAASGQAIEDRLLETPVALFNIDEINTLFNQFKAKVPGVEPYYKVLLSLFTASGSQFVRRAKARDSRNPESDRDKKVQNPSLSIYGSAIPGEFYKSLSSRAIESGLLPRCLIFESNTYHPLQKPATEELPQYVARALHGIADINRYVRPYDTPRLEEIPDGPGAEDKRKELIERSELLNRQCTDEGDSNGSAVWCRAMEMVGKLAMIYAVSANPAKPEISPEGLDWGWRLFAHSSRRILEIAENNITDDKYDEFRNRVLDRIVSRGHKGIARSDLTRTLHCDKVPLDRAIDTLLESGQITMTLVGKTRIYHAAKTAKKGA